jgi:hypothetical protein
MEDGRAYELLRFRTRGGEETTVYLVRHPLARTRVTVTCFAPPERLDHWCAATGHAEAMVAGFFLRDPYRPLGEVRIRGAPVPHEPVAAPWRSARGCVHAGDSAVRLAPREELAAEPAGDLVQAGSSATTTATARASRPAPRSSTPTSPSAATPALRWA